MKTSLHWSPEAILKDFHEVAIIAGSPIEVEILIENLPPPHKPTPLPVGFMGVYTFNLHGQTLKVGKAGPKSKSRFISHHYNLGKVPSTLAKTLLKNRASLNLVGIDSENIGDWIKTNTHRVNFLLPSELGDPVLNLLEAFVQCRLNPIFEGFSRR